MNIMYKYTFILNNGQIDQVIGDSFQSVLKNYFQWRAVDLLGGVELKEIKVVGYPKSKGSAYNVDAQLIDQIIETLKTQNTALIPKSEAEIQQERCQDMKNTCPEGSRDVDPIMQYEDWCDDVPYKEFVKNSADISQCYRLSNLLQAFTSGLEATKNDAPMPQWPVDPVSGVGVSAKTLQALYEQAKYAQIEIPELFVKFMNALNAGRFDVDAAVKGQYVGTTDKISIDYRKGFVEPAVELLFSKQKQDIAQTQEEKDLQMALQLAQQFGYQ